MKFGDLILNTHSGERNPLRVSMFLRYSGEFIECLSRNATIVKYYARNQRKDQFLKVIGSVDMSEWDAKAELARPAEASEAELSPDDMASIKRGLEQAAAGQTEYLGSFAKPPAESAGEVPASPTCRSFTQVPWAKIIGMLGSVQSITPSEVRFGYHGRDFILGDNGGEYNIFELVKAYPESIEYEGRGKLDPEDMAARLVAALDQPSGEVPVDLEQAKAMAVSALRKAFFLLSSVGKHQAAEDCNLAWMALSSLRGGKGGGA